VTNTPRFGSGEWRDFRLADLLLAAGRAAQEQLPALRSLALAASTESKLIQKEQAVSEQTPFGFEDLKRILVDRVGLAESDVSDDLDATFDEMGLDSLAFVEIQLAMEQQYGFTIADEDAEQIHTVGESIDYVNRRLAVQV
jgi:acyl carrier protein